MLSFGTLSVPGRALGEEVVAPGTSSAVPRAEGAALRPRVGGEAGLAFLGSGGEFARSLRGGVSLGLASARAGFGVTALATAFRSEEVPSEAEEWLVTLDLGVTGHLNLLDAHARSALGFGPSILLRGADVDSLTSAPGLFVDLRPLGVRFPLGARTALVLDPLGVLVLAPRLSATPLVDVQFNTTLSVEVLP